MTEVVSKAVNYSDEMVAEMVFHYEANPSKETVEKLAVEFGKTTRSIVAKLVREGVYKAAPRVTKTGAPVVRKSEIVAELMTVLGASETLASLDKASKADLEALLALVQDR